MPGPDALGQEPSPLSSLLWNRTALGRSAQRLRSLILSLRSVLSPVSVPWRAVRGGPRATSAAGVSRAEEVVQHARISTCSLSIIPSRDPVGFCSSCCSMREETGGSERVSVLSKNTQAVNSDPDFGPDSGSAAPRTYFPPSVLDVLTLPTGHAGRTQPRF